MVNSQVMQNNTTTKKEASAAGGALVGKRRGQPVGIVMQVVFPVLLVCHHTCMCIKICSSNQQKLALS